jgi:hypothetical protein
LGDWSHEQRTGFYALIDELSPEAREHVADHSPWVQSRDLDKVLHEYQVVEDEMVDWEPVWPLSRVPGVDPVEITLTEADLLDDKWPWEQRRIQQLRDESFGAAEFWFPVEDENGDEIRGVGDGHNDAWRHAYFFGRLSGQFGTEFAYQLGTAHEGKGEHGAVSEAMDLYNNEMGIIIAERNPDLEPGELGFKIAEAINNGDALVVDGEGNLAFSDSVSPGWTGDHDQGFKLPGVIDPRE